MTNIQKIMQIFRVIASLLIAQTAWWAFQEGEAFRGTAMILVSALLIYSVFEIHKRSQIANK